MDDPATDGFDTGFDFGTGFGLIQADKAVNAIAPQSQSPSSTWINRYDLPREDTCG